nr:phosphoglycerate kinase [Desulfosporosinus orientis]
MLDWLCESLKKVEKNVRLHTEEEKNVPESARKLSSLADLFVNDFGTVHYAHAQGQCFRKTRSPL